jgi:L-serine deaminase
MTIAQLVYDNERHYLTDEQISAKVSGDIVVLCRLMVSVQLAKIWSVMDECIRTGVSTTEKILPGRLQLRRRAPMLYQRLMRG